METSNTPTVLPTRELYCPSHFGNTYESTLPNEIKALMVEAKFWGFNRFTDWFDTVDLYNLYEVDHGHLNMPEALWARKFGNYQAAAEQGLDLGLVVTPNHVFSDQVTPQNQATKTHGIFGQLVCPSKPGVTEMILQNYQHLFEDFSRRGLKLASISGGAYDYGGCVCDQCQPWIITFGKLFKQIAKLAKTHFGSIRVELWGWWWKPQDHEHFTQWANQEAPDFFDALSFHLPYGVTEYVSQPIPANCAEQAFVHIAYGEESNRDSYCHYGANLAPMRLEKTVRNLLARHAQGFLAYSEGDHDDINKAILGGLSSGQYTSADEVLQTYADRHFRNDPKGWSDLIYAMGDFESIDLTKCSPLWDKLSGDARPSWRLAQIGERLNMAKAHQAVQASDDWDVDRIAAAEAFLAAKERLYREVWRMGIQRHAFGFEHNLPQWHADFALLKGKKKTSSALNAYIEA